MKNQKGIGLIKLIFIIIVVIAIITPKNIDNMVYLYQKGSETVMEFNDKLLEYYREILK